MVLSGHINSQEDVHRINKVATEAGFPLYVSADNEMYDARSFVCLFNLIGKDVNVIAKDMTDPKKFEKTFKKMRI